MKIAYLTGEYPRATDTFIQREVASLRDLGHEVLTYSIRRTDPVHHVGVEQKAEAAKTFHVLRAAKNPVGLLAAHLRFLVSGPTKYAAALKLALTTGSPGLKGRFYQLIYFAEAAVLANRLRGEGIQHLHNHIATSSASVAMLASKMSGIPFSFTLHGPDIFFAADKWRLDEKIRQASFVACISHYCRSQAMISAAPEDWAKLHIVHCGINPEKYKRQPVEGTPRLLFVGRLAAVKGVPLLLDCMAWLVGQGHDLALDLIGDGPDRSKLEAKVKTLGLEGRVIFHGYRNQDEVADVLSRAALFVLPSFAEGLPVVLMEAMAAECPSIATRIAGIPELVREGETGRMVDPGDVDALCKAIAQALADPRASAKMARQGKAIVAADFNSAIEAARLSTLFHAYANDLRDLPVRPEPRT